MCSLHTSTIPTPIFSTSNSPITHLPILPFFFFNDTATTEIYTLSLHDALPIYAHAGAFDHHRPVPSRCARAGRHHPDRKSTRLNSSHVEISYAVFCLKKKNKKEI